MLLPRSMKLFVAYASIAIGLASCAAIVGVKDGVLEDGGADGTTQAAEGGADGGTDGTTSADTSFVDGGDAADGADGAARDATLDGSDAAQDASTGDSATTPDADAASVSEGGDADAGGCLSQVVDTANGVFVASGGSSASTCGTIGTPCGGVQLGLDRANALGRSIVYVAAATYTESINLYPGITLQGGWTVASGPWTPICTAMAAQAVTIAAPSSANVTVTASALGATATLQTLTILSMAASSVQPGQSIYGIVAVGATTTLELQDVSVQTVAGGAGTTGVNGDAGAAASGACPFGTGDNGTVGPAGTGSPGGTYSSTGYAAGNGGPGTPGGAGGNGTQGGDGGCANCVTPGCVGTGCGVASTMLTCGQPGTSGCGGSGGGAGTGGGGGGSSIPLFLWDARVTCVDTTLTAGAGGGGGNGGAGSDGGAGSAGQAGTGAGTCDTTVPTGLLCVTPCTTTATPVVMDGGAPGGKGGTGGPGGAGGGGAGGWSCAYYLGGAASLNASGSASSFTFGNPGSGGQLGGTDGVAKEKCPP